MELLVVGAGPYGLAAARDRGLDVTVLGHHLDTSLPGLYMPGFAATRDFGPLFGFVKAAPAAGTLIARDLTA